MAGSTGVLRIAGIYNPDYELSCCKIDPESDLYAVRRWQFVTAVAFVVFVVHCFVPACPSLAFGVNFGVSLNQDAHMHACVPSVTHLMWGAEPLRKHPCRRCFPAGHNVILQFCDSQGASIAHDDKKRAYGQYHCDLILVLRLVPCTPTRTRTRISPRVSWVP